MRNKGFTLIELMIVAAIIGILAAVIIPAFKGHKNSQAQSVETIRPAVACQPSTPCQ